MNLYIVHSSKISIQFAKRLKKFLPICLLIIVHKRNELVAKGVDIINMAAGDPNRLTSSHILQAMHEVIEDAANHNYPPYEGTKKFRVRRM